MSEIQQPNKSAGQIGEVGRTGPPIWGGGVTVCTLVGLC